MAISGEEILVILSLTEYYPSRLSYSQATTIRDDDGIAAGNSQRGLKLVNHLLKCDYKELEKITLQINEENNNRSATKKETQSEKAKVFSFLKSKTTTKSKLLNPMDVMTVLLRCCDEILRQILIEKLVSVKMSVPIILPPLQKNGTEPMVLSWSLKSLVSESISNGPKYLIHIPQPIISFIRVGNLHRSKSKLLSDFLSKTSPPAFYHRECPGASAKRGPSNGSIEIAWFQSAVDSDEDFQFNCDLFTILNLRGDANDFPMQTKLLCESSSLVVIMADSVDSLDRWHAEIVDRIHWEKVKIVIAIVSKKADEYILELEQFVNTSSLSNHAIDITIDFKDHESMSFAEWRMHIQKIIGEFLSEFQKEKCSTLERFIEDAKSLMFQLEDDNHKLDSSKMIADFFVNCVQEKLQSKSAIFSLQGDTLRELAELEKRNLRDTANEEESTHAFVDQLRTKIKDLREKQLSTIRGFSKAEKEFYEALYTPTMEDSVFLISLKLAKLKFFEITKQIIELEDIIRELGQIYEASINCLQESFMVPLQGNDYTPKAAGLFILGQPLELLNGDASYIPISWVNKVFSRVAKRTNDRKVFVLSIIGIQSSGKSSLLNALFGVNFPTSAGRCTSGLFCHLLKLHDTIGNSYCDYVMILDAEGFRAPEYVKTSTERDNEMATFIFGLSDLTIVNIEGENWSEMKDILQIVVYALLRIRQTKHKIEFMPSCVFVHQKISALDVREKLKSGKAQMLNYLDEMVEASAQSEGYQNITAFNDVVTYNDEADSYFLPNMWFGNHPFATISSDYCKAVANLRSDLTKRFRNGRNCLNFTDIRTRISDLWQATCRENFVFSFRDTKQALDYKSLSSAFSGIEWNFRNSNQKMITEITNKIVSAENFDSFPKIEVSLLTELEFNFEGNCRKADEELKRMLSSGIQKDAAEIFRKKFEEKLNCLKESEKQKMKKKIDVEINLQKKKVDNRKTPRTRQKELFSSLSRKRKSGCSRQDLVKHIDNLWYKTYPEEANRYEALLYRSKIDIRAKINELLSKYEIKMEWSHGKTIPEVTEDDFVGKSIRNLLIQQSTKNTYGILPTAAANEMCKQLFNDCKLILETFNGLDFEESQVETVFKLVAEFFKQPFEKLHEEKQATDMSSTETGDLFELIPTEENQTQEPEAGLYFRSEFKNKYFMAIGHFMYEKLILFKEDFIKKTHAYYDDKQLIKKIVLRDRENESLLAAYIVEEAEKAVFRGHSLSVTKTLEQRDKSITSKKAFTIKLLTDLANDSKRDFSKYVEFFADFSDFCEKELGSYMPTVLNDDTCSMIASILNKDIKALIKKIQEDIISSFKNCNDSPETFIKNLHTQLDGKIAFCLEIALNSFSEMTGNTTIENLREIVDQLKTDLDTLTQGRNCNISDKVKSYFKENCVKEMYEQWLSGCPEKCPFCSAPCLEQTKDHTPHIKHHSFHYPVGVRGTVANSSGFLQRIFKLAFTTFKAPSGSPQNATSQALQEATSHIKSCDLVIECCPSLIQSKHWFRSDHIIKYKKFFHRIHGKNAVKYKDYQKEFPDWEIPLLSEMKANGNDYWKWLMAEYGTKFADKYKVACPPISEKWRKISSSDAVKSISALLSDAD